MCWNPLRSPGKIIGVVCNVNHLVLLYSVETIVGLKGR